VGKGRLEAFSDGVLAIIITIMVLELKVPTEGSLAALRPLGPVAVGYLVSFAYIGIYWNNHHHLIHLVKKVDGRVMWANLHLLFWLSLLPFATAWLSEGHAVPEPVPAAVYGIVLLMAALAWIPLQRALIACNGGVHSRLARAIGGPGGDWKVTLSPILYLAGIASAFFEPIVSCIAYAVVACLWFIPDRRIERHSVASP
jgi:uncharacterized membrane protein